MLIILDICIYGLIYYCIPYLLTAINLYTGRVQQGIKLNILTLITSKVSHPFNIISILYIGGAAWRKLDSWMQAPAYFITLEVTRKQLRISATRACALGI